MTDFVFIRHGQRRGGNSCLLSSLSPDDICSSITGTTPTSFEDDATQRVRPSLAIFLQTRRENASQP